MRQLTLFLLFLSCTTGSSFQSKSKGTLRVFVVDTGVNPDIPIIRRYLRLYNPQTIKDPVFDHGSHIIGIIANAACPGVEIIPCKGNNDVLASNACLRHALNLNIDIINFSMGGYYPEDEEKSLFGQLSDQGVKINAAAGNENVPLFLTSYYPASYPFKNINIVGALKDNGERADFSNYKDDMVWEPGIQIESFDRFGGKIKFSGTSQATANHTARMVREWCQK